MSDSLAWLQGRWLDEKNSVKRYIVEGKRCMVLNADPNSSIIPGTQNAVHWLSAAGDDIFWGLGRNFVLSWRDDGDTVEWVPLDKAKKKRGFVWYRDTLRPVNEPTEQAVGENLDNTGAGSWSNWNSTDSVSNVDNQHETWADEWYEWWQESRASRWARWPKADNSQEWLRWDADSLDWGQAGVSEKQDPSTWADWKSQMVTSREGSDSEHPAATKSCVHEVECSDWSTSVPPGGHGAGWVVLKELVVRASDCLDSRELRTLQKGSFCTQIAPWIKYTDAIVDFIRMPISVGHGTNKADGFVSVAAKNGNGLIRFIGLCHSGSTFPEVPKSGDAWAHSDAVSSASLGPVANISNGCEGIRPTGCYLATWISLRDIVIRAGTATDLDGGFNADIVAHLPEETHCHQLAPWRCLDNGIVRMLITAEDHGNRVEGWVTVDAREYHDRTGRTGPLVMCLVSEPSFLSL